MRWGRCLLTRPIRRVLRAANSKTEECLSSLSLGQLVSKMVGSAVTALVVRGSSPAILLNAAVYQVYMMHFTYDSKPFTGLPVVPRSRLVERHPLIGKFDRLLFFILSEARMDIVGMIVIRGRYRRMSDQWLAEISLCDVSRDEGWASRRHVVAYWTPYPRCLLKS